MDTEVVSPTAEPLFEALIVPHRSLTPRGVRMLMAALLALGGAIALRFWLLGAWPVAWFGVAEAVFAAILVYLNMRRARASELVLLTAESVRIVRTGPSGRRAERIVASGWLTVVLEEQAGRTPRLLLRDRSGRTEIAASLGAEEKRELARALDEALRSARYPVFDNPQLRD